MNVSLLASAAPTFRPLLQSAALPDAAEPIIGAVMLGYALVVLLIGVLAARVTRNAADFFVAGARLGLVTTGLAAMAATLSGFAFIGGPGLVYTLGLGAVFIVLPAALTNTMSVWTIARRLRLLADVRPMVTIPDAIAARYDSRLAQGLAATAILVAVLGYAATNFLALGLVLDAVFGIGRTPAIWAGALLVVAYTVTGGILAGVWNDVFQGILMAVASALVFWYALDVTSAAGGLVPLLLQHAPERLGAFGTMSPLAALSFYFVFGLGTLGQPQVVHKFFMLRDPARLRWFPVVMTVAMTLSLLLFVGVGLAMRALVAAGVTEAPATADDVTPLFLLRFTPAPLAALVFAGTAAAIMSTVNSFLSIGAAACTRDLPRALGRPVRNELRTGRVWTLALAALATLIADRSGLLVAFLGIFGWGLFASTLVPALAIGLNWTGATRAGAIASIATGLVITLALETLAWFKVFQFPAGVTATAIALVVSLLVFFVVSWVTRATADDTLAPDIRAIVEA